TEIELTSLIGNLLDNAIEAAHAASDPHPFVTLHCDFRSGILLIRVKNTKVSTARPIETNMQTTKLNKDYHGLGLHILSSIVKKYDGTMKMTDQGDTFQTSVSLVLG
ncbi:ATP-binding protein, partial [Pseudomonas aeruginosa]|nr:ATP-binding protein [Pseudomonas aeruginosa]